jgi:hypothetical protein
LHPKLQFFDNFADQNFSGRGFMNSDPWASKELQKYGQPKSHKMPNKIHLSTALREFFPFRNLVSEIRAKVLEMEATSAKGTSPNMRTQQRRGRPCDMAETWS